jgi:DNA polymerase V
MLLDLAPVGQTQASLFDPLEEQAKHSEALMTALDSLNSRFGRDTLTVAAVGTRKRWLAKAENKTPCYTTRWNELPKAFAR